MVISSRFLATFFGLLSIFIVVFQENAFGVLRQIRKDYWSIQAGINAASSGDTILVEAGIYKENINFKGKNIVVGSLFLITGDTSYIRRTIIDGNRNGHVVTFAKGESSNAVLCGFTITDGKSADGGGIICSNKSSPRLFNLLISENNADDWGGGIYCGDSSPIIVNVIISGNSAGRFGGGIAVANLSRPNFMNVVIADNYSSGDGGGIHCYDSDPTFVNVTCSRNTAVGNGGGIFCSIRAHPRLMSSILWGNSPQEIFSANPGDKYNYNIITIFYSNIQGGREEIVKNDYDILEWLDGNIDFDPQFEWIGDTPFQLSALSPCINRGKPDTSGLHLPVYDLNGSPRIRYDIIDMGAYEYQGVPKVITPVFFPSPGRYHLRQYVTIYTITPGATIYYSADETEPTENSSVYTKPILATGATTLKAKAYKSGWDASSAAIGIYEIKPGTRYRVPVDFPTIQAAIDSVVDGDTILVEPGRYKENINFKSKNLVLGSLFLTTGDTTYIAKTIIDGNKKGSVIEFNHGEDSTAVVSGLVITNGNGVNGGGIHCSNRSSSKLEYVVISGNSASNGGGIYCSEHSLIILEQVMVEENVASAQGGGIYCNDTSNVVLTETMIERNTGSNGGGGIWSVSSNVVLINSTISDNKAISSSGGGCAFIRCDTILLADALITRNVSYSSGGAIYCVQSAPTLINVTISGNEGISGGAIYCLNEANPRIVNSILWENEPGEIYLSDGPFPHSSITIVYSDVRDGESGILNNNMVVNWLEGNINIDPAFVGSGAHPYRLSESSPCINAGSQDTSGLNLPRSDILRNQRIFNGRIKRVDIGTYEYQGEPSVRMAPLAVFIVSPRVGSMDTIFQVNGSGSSDTQDSTSDLVVRWDWENDGKWDTEYSKEKQAAHKYVHPGKYVIKLEVKDRDGLISTTTKKVLVLAQVKAKVESDSMKIHFPYYNTAIALKFDSVKNVLGKEIIITSHGDTVPEYFHSNVFFDRAVGYYSLESNQIYNLKALLSFFYTDSLLNALDLSETNLEIAFWDEFKQQWKALPTIVDERNNMASTFITHLSLWALTDKTDKLISSVKEERSGEAINNYNLSQNYPNPFNPITVIKFQIPKLSQVTLRIYNILGQKVKILINKILPAGIYEIHWDGSDSFGSKVASGIYICRLEISAGYSKTIKMVYMK